MFLHMMLGHLMCGGPGLLALLWTFIPPLVSPQGLTERPKLLLVSFDGFRWDYVNRVPTPNFHVLMQEGVTVEQVKNVYITKTLPNHYSLVTGLYAETHGIVANDMFDPVLNRSFSMETESLYESQWWEQAVPLWVTIQKSGGRSGAAMWPGSDVKIHGIFPTRYLPYNASVAFETRVEHLIKWFSAPDQEAVDFGILYWEEPDESGHDFGPESSQMDGVIADVDEKLGFLLNELKKAGLYKKVNLVVTSDHGMTQLFPNKIIELDEYVSRDLYTLVDKSPVVAILPKEGKLDEVYNKLSDANPYMAVYRKDAIPERLHYRHNVRIMPILLEAREGWTIVQNRSTPLMLGNHGYDNTLRSMQPIFFARGPAFRQNYVKPTMLSVDLYPLMCHILAIPPLPNNGSLSDVRDLLHPEPTASPPGVPTPAGTARPTSFPVLLGSLLGVLLVAGFLIVFVQQLTLMQLPLLKQGSREMSQPLLQEELHL
ncbi:ectonucleotide pyrophosphatase/phosphodiesterase family member 5 isoform X1 [Syngnathus acus]|uniref:ectonucleotide pyrophosphatase/phosphodiesterase family member 5 isoform X1 n=2 Tax=Syngnathus acus TaxID=161584 RepID=UPI001885B5EE|nr:ectonucleotide pyrophosphatase/phosphodiesterase family member 5 isoform X1 [Syngnathus acus]